MKPNLEIERVCAERKLGWHFVGKTLRDERPIPDDGVWLEHTGPVKMCASGLHVGVTPFDALRYAPGPVLCLVEYDREADRWADKILARRRRILTRMDAAKLLRYFARMEALSVVHLWDAPDVVLDFLMTGESASTAWDAAGDAAGAAWAAAGDAAGAAGAARAAAGAVARAAWAAAGDAAGAAWAAGAAARAAARDGFNSLIYECFEDWL